MSTVDEWLLCMVSLCVITSVKRQKYCAKIQQCNMAMIGNSQVWPLRKQTVWHGMTRRQIATKHDSVCFYLYGTWIFYVCEEECSYYIAGCWPHSRIALLHHCGQDGTVPQDPRKHICKIQEMCSLHGWDSWQLLCVSCLCAVIWLTILSTTWSFFSLNARSYKRWSFTEVLFLSQVVPRNSSETLPRNYSSNGDGNSDGGCEI